MVLLVEQERLIGAETQLIDDSTTYDVPTSFGTIHDYGNITLSEAGLVAITLAINSSGGVSAEHCFRVKVGNYYAYIKIGAAPFASGTFGTLIRLAAGTYDVLTEGVRDNANVLQITSMKVGLVKFNDVVGSALGTYSSGIALTVTSRVTPAGTLLQATYAVQVFASTPTEVTNLENVGDNLTNGVSILVDGVQVNWSERIYPDTADAHGVSGKVFLPYTVGAAHTVTISKRDANTVVHISVIACPWILSNSVYTPVTPNFSQGTTIYAYLNPLFTDPTKFVGIGFPHGVSFGTATDYYDTTTGTGLIEYYYAFEVPQMSQNNMYLSGMGGCMEIIGVDVR